MDLPVVAGAISTSLFAASMLPMLVKAARTKDLGSYSIGNLALSNVANLIHSVYVFNLPLGPIWLLHSFYVVVTALMLLWWLWYSPSRAARSADDGAHGGLVAGDDGGSVVGGDDRPLDQDRVRDHRGDPRTTMFGIAGQRVESGRTGGGFARAGDMPWLEAEAVDHRGELGLRGGVVKVAAHHVLDSGIVERRRGGATLGTARIDPDLHCRIVGVGGRLGM